MREKFVFAVLLLTISFGTVAQERSNWTHFRGSNLNGISAITRCLFPGMIPQM